MDPFSILVGTVGLLDVCSRLLRYLANTPKNSKTFAQELESIAKDIEAVCTATSSVEAIYKVQVGKNHQSIGSESTASISCIWENIALVISRCEKLICHLQRFLEEIQAVRGPKKWDDFLKHLRKQEREREYGALRRELSNYIVTLQMLLSTIQISATWENRSTQAKLTDEIRAGFSQLNSKIELFQPLLESGWGSEIRGAFNTARGVAFLHSRNKYFDLPQPVSSIFTGREDTLQELEKMMFDPVTDSDMQKRFVIYGLGGSGKTQFCCKFAQDNRQRFWGVFWIDGSSEQRTRQTYSRIAKSAGLEPNHRAAMNWLSSSEQPWLLIIDNADEAIELDNYFPTGERGHILITTRNPFHQVYGTIGDGFIDFSNWDPGAATDLLLKAANQPLPWTSSVKSLASKITTTLGYLPLALIIAGRSIVKRLCTLSDYLTFYEMNWKRVRHQSRGLSTNEIRLATKTIHI